MRLSIKSSVFILTFYASISILLLQVPAYLYLAGISSVRPAVYSVVLNLICLSFICGNEGDARVDAKLLLFVSLYLSITTYALVLNFTDAGLGIWIGRTNGLVTLVLVTSFFKLLLRRFGEDLVFRHLNVISAAVVISFFLEILNVVQFVGPEAELYNPGRAAGFFVNANGAGLYLCFSMIFAFESVKTEKLLVVLIVLFLAGVFITFSRAAWLISACIVLYYCIRREAFFKAAFLSLVTILILSATAIYFVQTVSSLPIEAKDVISVMQQRFDWFDSSDLGSDISYVERIRSLEESYERIAQSPLAGNGLGMSVTEGARPHNFYLESMVEHGVILFVLSFPFLIYVLIGDFKKIRRLNLAFVLVLVTAGVFTHGIFEFNPYLIFYMALVLSLRHEVNVALPTKSWSNRRGPITGRRDAWRRRGTLARERI